MSASADYENPWMSNGFLRSVMSRNMVQTRTYEPEYAHAPIDYRQNVLPLPWIKQFCDLYIEDLFQEARLRGWLSVTRFDPTRGTLPGFVGFGVRGGASKMVQYAYRHERFLQRGYLRSTENISAMSETGASSESGAKAERCMVRPSFEEDVVSRIWVNDLIETIPDQRARDVVRRRIGADGYSETLQEIADDHDVTREMIRQIEAKTLSQLRRRVLLDQRGVLLEGSGKPPIKHKERRADESPQPRTRCRDAGATNCRDPVRGDPQEALQGQLPARREGAPHRRLILGERPPGSDECSLVRPQAAPIVRRPERQEPTMTNEDIKALRDWANDMAKLKPSEGVYHIVLRLADEALRRPDGSTREVVRVSDEPAPRRVRSPLPNRKWTRMTPDEKDFIRECVATHKMSYCATAKKVGRTTQAVRTTCLAMGIRSEHLSVLQKKDAKIAEELFK